MHVYREVIEKLKADAEEATGKDTEGGEDATPAPAVPSPTETQTKGKVKSAKSVNKLSTTWIKIYNQMQQQQIKLTCFLGFCSNL